MKTTDSHSRQPKTINFIRQKDMSVSSRKTRANYGAVLFSWILFLLLIFITASTLLAQDLDGFNDLTEANGKRSIMSGDGDIKATRNKEDKSMDMFHQAPVL